MTSTHSNAELIHSSKGSPTYFNPLKPIGHSKRPYKLEAPDKESKRKVDPSTVSLFAYSAAEFNECPRCEAARMIGLDAWMEHLGQMHTLPSRWPSSKIDGGLINCGHPYTSVVDSHKKRRSAGIPRPLNSFMIFAQYIRRLTLSSFPDAPNVHISQQVGRLWRNLSNDFREVYAKEARRLQSLHSLEFPDYKYQPRRRLRTLDGEEIDSHSSPLRPVHNPPPPSSATVNQYLGERLHHDNSRCQPKLSPPVEFDSEERPNLTHGLLDLTMLCHNSNMDTLTSLQGANSQRGAVKQQTEDFNVYHPAFSCSASTDGVTNRLGWTDDKLIEPYGPPSAQLMTPITASSFLPPEDIFSSSEHWYQYHKDGSFGDALPLPGIETWTFSSSAI